MVEPNYYRKFSCIAEKCRHNCCIGWEIDIDEETAARYAAMTGETGEQLRRNMDGDPPHFLMDGEGRCPCLTAENLCSLILLQGEDALCQICRDHPRFYNEWGDRTEVGLGACCEAAADLILSQKEPLRLIPDGTELTDPYLRALDARRAKMIRLAYAARPLEERMDAILDAAEAPLDHKSVSDWAEQYLALERLDPAWTKILEDLIAYGDQADSAAFDRFIAPREMEFAHMLAYFLYRHVPEAQYDEDLPSKAGFAVLSVRILRTIGARRFALYGDFSFADQVELFRVYSAEIEYDEENLEALYDALWEE